MPTISKPFFTEMKKKLLKDSVTGYFSLAMHYAQLTSKLLAEKTHHKTIIILKHDLIKATYLK